MDTLAALTAAVAEGLQSQKVNFDMDDGTQCEVAVHPEVSSDVWVGRTLDFSRAYKQLALDEASRLLAVVGSFHKDKWLFFRSDVLPSGAIAAVYSFNRVSRSLRHLICKLLWGPCTCFYDDYPTISPKASSSLLSKSMSNMLTLLGWDHAKVGSKAIDFADFNALGVSVQLRNLNKGAFILCNKEGRIERLCAMLQKIRENGFISKSEAAQIQGHLNFACGFYISKALRFLSSSFSIRGWLISPRLWGREIWWLCLAWLLRCSELLHRDRMWLSLSKAPSLCLRMEVGNQAMLLEAQ